MASKENETLSKKFSNYVRKLTFSDSRLSTAKNSRLERQSSYQGTSSDNVSASESLKYLPSLQTFLNEKQVCGVKQTSELNPTCSRIEFSSASAANNVLNNPCVMQKKWRLSTDIKVSKPEISPLTSTELSIDIQAGNKKISPLASTELTTPATSVAAARRTDETRKVLKAKLTQQRSEARENFEEQIRTKTSKYIVKIKDKKLYKHDCNLFTSKVYAIERLFRKRMDQEMSNLKHKIESIIDHDFEAKESDLTRYKKLQSYEIKGIIDWLQADLKDELERNNTRASYYIIKKLVAF